MIWKRGAQILYSYSLYVGIGIAIIYCFVFWKLRNLEKYRIPLFVYAVVMQLAFLIFYAWFTNYFKTTESLNRDYYDIFGNGIILFYVLLIVPFIISLCVQTYKGVSKLEIEKAAKIMIMALFVVLCLFISVAGFYLHVFFYYGFAP